MTQTYTGTGFCRNSPVYFRYLVPTGGKIVFITANLNTHSATSLYKAFSPEEARRSAEYFKGHYTPKHASRLDMAEIEIGIMSCQALGSRCSIWKALNSRFVQGLLGVMQNVPKLTGSLRCRMHELNWPDCIQI